MAFQEFELNMIPHGDMPSFYASQYETGRPIIIDIMMGEDAFNCDELYIELHCRKVDDNIVTLQPDSVDGNQVTFIGTDQLFACPGKNVAEICLYADETKDTSLGSLNFFIEVEPDPMAGGLTSESSIYDLRQQIEEITEEVIGEDYYDKTEVDDLLDLKADKSNTYTKTEVDNALNLKADKSTTYTKSQIDSALALKADASSVYTKGQTDTLLNAKANTSDLATVATSGSYNDLTNKPTIPAAQVQSDWSQADNTKVDYIKNKPDLSVYATNEDLADAIYSILPVDTASGAIANFNTEIGADLVDCKAYIVASQSTGTPTPSNPLPISGYTGVTISVADENMSVQDTYTISWQDEAGTVYGGNIDLTTGVLTVTWGSSNLSDLTWYYNAGKKIFYSSSLANDLISITGDTVYNALSNEYQILSVNNLYNNETDNSLAIGYIYSDKNVNVIDNRYTSANNFKTNVTGMITYELSTPQTYQLTPTQVRALVGVNNVFNDTNGNTEVQFKDSIQHYIDTRP